MTPWRRRWETLRLQRGDIEPGLDDHLDALVAKLPGVESQADAAAQVHDLAAEELNEAAVEAFLHQHLG